MSSEAAWVIAKSGAIAPPAGSVYGAAYLVRAIRGSSSREVIAKFADAAAVASAGYAEEVTRPFLGDDEPPQHLVVEAAGTVRVERGHASRSMTTKAIRARQRLRIARNAREAVAADRPR